MTKCRTEQYLIQLLLLLNILFILPYIHAQSSSTAPTSSLSKAPPEPSSEDNDIPKPFVHRSEGEGGVRDLHDLGVDTIGPDQGNALTHTLHHSNVGNDSTSYAYMNNSKLQSHSPKNDGGLTTNSKDALVICGIDGMVRTLDAWTGQLRGAFISGEPLVTSSGEDNPTSYHECDEFQNHFETDHTDDTFDDIDETDEEVQAYYDDDDEVEEDEEEDEHSSDDNDNLCVKEIVVPGLDGNLYTYTQYITSNNDVSEVQNSRLDLLPIRVEDVVRSPFHTCRSRKTKNDAYYNQKESDYYSAKNDEEECGLIMGQRSTKIFSLDPLTGTVKWMQVPSGSGAGFTVREHAKFGGSDVSNGSTVLLKRDDYAVRSVDVKSGEETWNVTLGTITAFDFFQDGEDSRTGQRFKTSKRRNLKLNSQGLASISHDSGASPKFDKPGERDEKDMNGRKSNEFHDSFPSISFGDDGTSIRAFDKSGNVLWEQNMDGVVAAVYGVDGVGSWRAVDVIDNQDISDDEMQKTNASANSIPAISETAPGDFDKQVTQYALDNVQISPSFHKDFTVTTDGNMLTSSSMTSCHAASSHNPFRPQHSSCPPLSKPQARVRLRVDSSNFFVESDLTSNFRYPSSQNLHLPIHNVIKDQKIKAEDLSEDQVDHYEEKDNFFHKTQDGIFLTWQMVLILTSSILIGIFGVGYTYMKKKQKWMSLGSPVVLPSTTNFDMNRANELNIKYLSQINSPHKGGNLLYDASNDSTEPVLPHFSIGAAATRNNEDKSSSKISSLYKKMHDVFADSIPTRNSGGKRSPLSRSVSSPELNSHSLDGSEDEVALPSQLQQSQNQVVTKNKESQKAEKDLMNGDTVILPPNSSTSTTAISRLTSATSVDGLPLVRYSRFKSEFNELSPLGKGGFGTVFRCANALDGREYAVKKVHIKIRVGSDGQVTENVSKKLQRVIREVKILAVLEHPNIVRYYTAWLEVQSRDKLENSMNGDIDDLNTRNGGDFESETCTDDNSEVLGTSSTTLGHHGKSRKGLTRDFSSELLVGKSNFSTSRSIYHNQDWTQSPRSSTNLRNPKNYKRIESNSSLEKSILKGNASSLCTSNPLGWSSFPTGYQIPEHSSSVMNCSDIIDGNSSIPHHLQPSQSKSNDSNIYGSQQARNIPSLHNEDDLGFTWERSNSGLCTQSYNGDVAQPPQQNGFAKENSMTIEGLTTIEDKSFSARLSCDQSSECTSHSSSQHSTCWQEIDNYKSSKFGLDSNILSESEHDDSQLHSKSCNGTHTDERMNSFKNKIEFLPQKHILYIQMELCKKTLLDFFKDDMSSKNVDIPNALRMFCHIARGIQHVHQQGLIHRDLKPSNCFMDDAEVVKIGDFGLSRESSENTENNDVSDHIVKNSQLDSSVVIRNNAGDDANVWRKDNTAGVGTRSYASPEQMHGSDYDASTDVYSLGIILFELCYPMRTGMERFKVFEGIRKRVFPKQWHSSVAQSFPSIHNLLMAMLSHIPRERPSSAVVTNLIESLLGEYTVLSLDHKTEQKDAIFLRIEAMNNEGVLNRTTHIIKGVDSRVTILQYSLRGHESKTILEFALRLDVATKDGNEDIIDTGDESITTKAEKSSILQQIELALEGSEEISLVRQVNRKYVTRNLSQNSSD